MTTVLLATVLLTRQNPNSPAVRPLPGWRVVYWERSKSGRGGIVGPQGQEIGFPDYGSAGELANTLNLVERRGFYLYATVGGRPVAAAVRQDGFMAVSFGQAPRGRGESSPPFDYWMRVKDARGAAQLLITALTRLDFRRDYGNADSRASSTDSEVGRTSVSDLTRPPWLNSAIPNVKRHEGADHGPAGVWFDGPTVPAVGSRADLPAHPKWQERQTLFGRELIVQEGADGRLAVRLAPKDVGATVASAPVFTSAKATPETTIVAVFAALEYSAPANASAGS